MPLLAVYLIDSALFETTGARAGRCAANKYNFQGTEFWLDDVQCHGNESSLKDCPRKTWGDHDCIREEVAEVMCRGNYYKLFTIYTCMAHGAFEIFHTP